MRQERVMVIAQISDTHILARSSDDPVGASRADDLRRCIADINRQAVDAVIHTGDSVQNGTADEYAHLREILADLNAPLFITPGNRDRQATLRAVFEDFSYLPTDGDLLHYAVEHYPAREQEGQRPALPLHQHCLFKLGVPLGELWWLNDLAAFLRRAGRSRCLLTAPPLRLPGAAGSPVTPVATV